MTAVNYLFISNYTTSNFLMTRTYEGKTIVGNISLLAVFVLYILLVSGEGTDGIFTKLFILALGTATVSSTANMVIPAEICVLFVPYIILQRRWGMLPKVFACILPELVMMLVYVLYVKGRGLNNPLSLQLYLYDQEMFSIPVTSISRTAANSAEGYPLTITYTPSATGEHTTRLLIFDGGLTGSVGVELRARCLDAPTLSPITALEASGISDNGYTANWKAASEQVDYYVITRTVYNKENGDVRTETFNTDNGEETSYTFNDRQPGEAHTYSVQSYRLGYMSEPSNVITIDTSGLTGIEADKPLQVLAMDGGILIKCSEDVGSATVYDMAGRAVRHIDNLKDDMIIELPRGIYLLMTSTSRSAWKVAVR